jgi:FkbM family methyltransferase
LSAGGWIGPFALFAAKYASHVYVFEPDPIAYRSLYHNAKANPTLWAKMTLINKCVSDKREVMRMQSGALGNSETTLLGNFSKPGIATIDVQCITLMDFFDMYKVDIKDVGLMKIDTEGAESIIFPANEAWFKQHRPNLLLSLHAALFLDREEGIRAIERVVTSYKNPQMHNGEKIPNPGFSVVGWCKTCATFLTDNVSIDLTKDRGLVQKDPAVTGTPY